MSLGKRHNITFLKILPLTYFTFQVYSPLLNSKQTGLDMCVSSQFPPLAPPKDDQLFLKTSLENEVYVETVVRTNCVDYNFNLSKDILKKIYPEEFWRFKGKHDRCLGVFFKQIFRHKPCNLFETESIVCVFLWISCKIPEKLFYRTILSEYFGKKHFSCHLLAILFKMCPSTFFRKFLEIFRAGLFHNILALLN